MSTKFAFVCAGALIGFFVGISTGVAFGGDAVNGAFIFCPLGGLIGWLAGSDGSASQPINRPDAPLDSNLDDSTRKPSEDSSLQHNLTGIGLAGASIMCSAWNFHMEILKITGAMPTVKAHPWILFAFPFIGTLVLPFYMPIYIILGLVALSFNASPDNEFEASVSRPKSGS